MRTGPSLVMRPAALQLPASTEAILDAEKLPDQVAELACLFMLWLDLFAQEAGSVHRKPMPAVRDNPGKAQLSAMASSPWHKPIFMDLQTSRNTGLHVPALGQVFGAARRGCAFTIRPRQRGAPARGGGTCSIGVQVFGESLSGLPFKAQELMQARGNDRHRRPRRQRRLGRAGSVRRGRA